MSSVLVLCLTRLLAHGIVFDALLFSFVLSLFILIGLWCAHLWTFDLLRRSMSLASRSKAFSSSTCESSKSSACKLLSYYDKEALIGVACMVRSLLISATYASASRVTYFYWLIFLVISWAPSLLSSIWSCSANFFFISSYADCNFEFFSSSSWIA